MCVFSKSTSSFSAWCNPQIAEKIRPTVDKYQQPFPPLLEIPSKDHPYGNLRLNLLSFYWMRSLKTHPRTPFWSGCRSYLEIDTPVIFSLCTWWSSCITDLIYMVIRMPLNSTFLIGTKSAWVCGSEKNYLQSAVCVVITTNSIPTSSSKFKADLYFQSANRIDSGDSSYL